jgi:DNA-binding CsgD family transcriptional regulator
MTFDRPWRLLGRRAERRVLDRMLDGLRSGQSSVLVVRAESGGGKTALLQHLRERAWGCQVARAVGVEPEMELTFAGLQQLCAPMLGRLGHLPDPQRDALRVAFGLYKGRAPDRLLVDLAALNLLSEVAGEQPLLCLVDDTQWLDRESIQALAFVARRLVAEPIALVFAVREPSDERELAGLPSLVVGQIGDLDARRLLASAVAGPLDEQVRDRIVAEARGNPLALLELPQELTPEELAGGFGLLEARPVASRVEQSFQRRLQRLPGETQRLLLAAAAEPVGDVLLLQRAAGQLGIDASAAAPAEAEGLVELGAQVRFRHPLARSAVYRSASFRDRQDVHRALAESTDPEIDPDRRAWHRARAASGPDEAVASDLERSAERAQGRGGVAASAAFLERAAELTPDPMRRGARALAAAKAKSEAGGTAAAWELLEVAEQCPLDELQRARLERLRAQITFTRSRGNDAPPLLLRAAKRLQPLDAGLARETYLETLAAAISAGRLGSDDGIVQAAEAARAAPAGPLPPRPIDLLLDGLVTRFTEGYAASVAPLRRALDAFSGNNGLGEDNIGWLWLACQVAPELWEDEKWHELAVRQVRAARDAGAITMLPLALSYLAGVHVHAGEFAAASALAEDGDSIARATGNAPFASTALVLAAWRGKTAEVSTLAASSVQSATARGEGRAIAVAWHATAVLNNGLGRYEAAADSAQRACEYDDLGLLAWSLVELVEAGARSAMAEVAAAALQRLIERTRPSSTEWALGIEARSRALLSEGQEAETHYRDAIGRLAGSRVSVHLARAHLLYGEWLRRNNRRADAREQLHLAHQMLTRIGAEAFAERARRELAATGETVRRRTVETLRELSPQQVQIAKLVREGHTNPEIGTELFLSPRTVEWHLHNMFTKLGISSRRELRDALGDL